MPTSKTLLLPSFLPPTDVLYSPTSGWTNIPVCDGIGLGVLKPRSALVPGWEPFLPGFGYFLPVEFFLLGVVSQKGFQHKAAMAYKAQVPEKVTE